MKDVWQFLDDRGVVIPERTDCATCYHQRIIEWYRLWQRNRLLFEKGAAIEAQQGHTFRTPGRDTWPVALADLSEEFKKVERGERKIRKFKRDEERDSCRVCSL